MLRPHLLHGARLCHQEALDTPQELYLQRPARLTLCCRRNLELQRNLDAHVYATVHLDIRMFAMEDLGAVALVGGDGITCDGVLAPIDC